jgi:hypothetical protein
MFLAMHKHSIGACPVKGDLAMNEDSVIDTQIDLMLQGLEVRAPAPARRKRSTRAA